MIWSSVTDKPREAAVDKEEGPLEAAEEASAEAVLKAVEEAASKEEVAASDNHSEEADSKAEAVPEIKW